MHIPINAQQSYIIKPSRTGLIDGNVPAGSSSDGKNPMCASKVITWDGDYAMWSDRNGADTAVLWTLPWFPLLRGSSVHWQPRQRWVFAWSSFFLFYWVFKGTVSVPFQHVCTTFTWQRNTVSIYSDFMLCVSQYELFQIEANSRHAEIWNQSDAISHLQKHTSCLTVNIHQQWTYPPYLFFLNLCLLLPFSARTKNKYVTIMQPNPSNQALLFQ